MMMTRFVPGPDTLWSLESGDTLTPDSPVTLSWDNGAGQIFRTDTLHDFRAALGRFATGVTVVTCQTELGPLGITANSFASVSLDPPLVLWSPAKSSSRYPAFLEAEHFAVHVLESGQRDLCRQFTKSGLDFSGLEVTEGEGGAPVIAGCLAHFECRRFATHDAGDHTIILGQVAAATAREGQPLVFSSGALGRFEA